MSVVSGGSGGPGPRDATARDRPAPEGAGRGEPAALDDLDLDRNDPEGVLATVLATGDHWQRALDAAPSVPTPAVGPGDVRRVVVAGMGGSGIVGDIAAVAARETGGVPVQVVKGFDLPGDVDPGVLVVLVSHSGATAETLACYAQASEVDAPRFVVTSGGPLAAVARDEGVPVAQVPPGDRPRTQLPYLATAVLLALDRSDLLPRGVVAEQLTLVGDHLGPLADRWGPGVPTADNPVKGLALAIADRVPVFYAASGWPSVAALRAKTQVNENAERPAFWSTVPELDHNELVGWGAPAAVTGGFAAVALRSPLDEQPPVATAMDTTRELLQGRVGVHREVEVLGPAPLPRFAALVLHVDLLSVYVAFLAGVDPAPTALIDEVKRRTGA